MLSFIQLRAAENYGWKVRIIEKRLNYQAQVGTLVAAYARIRKGLDIVEPRRIYH